MEGRVFGRYRVSELIASGGMGQVYAATHELMKRAAVVKVLLPEMSANQNIVKRFFNEAQAAASIHHPGIVEVFDSGYTDDGQAYLVMERLYGESLDARLRRDKTLPLAMALTLMRQLAGALGAAHERGIVHRDLKPDNLFIVPDPEVPGGERIKVLDFGLAKLADFKGSLVTMSGTVFGTPAYMAPEQCYDAATVDHRADLYAVGCILYRCLCGQTPFGSGGIEILAAQLRDQPRPPRSLAPALPPPIEAVILQLLEKKPGARIQTCQALVDAIDLAEQASAPTVASSSMRMTAASSLSLRATPDAATMQVAALTAADVPPRRPPSSSLSSLGHSAGQMLAPEPRRPRHRRIRLIAAAVTLFGVLGGGLALWQLRAPAEGLTTGPAAFPADPPELLATLDRHLTRAGEATEAQEWGDALDALERARAVDAHEPARIQRLADMREHAQRELRNQNTYNRFRIAALASDIEAVALLYPKISADSVYRPLARDPYERIREDWLDSAYNNAQLFTRDRACDELAAIVADVNHLFPDAESEFGKLTVECTQPLVELPEPPVDEVTPTKPAALTPARPSARKKDDKELAVLMSATELAEQASELYKKGQFGAAAKLCVKASSMAPGDMQAAILCSMAHCKLADQVTAQRYVTRLPVSRQRDVIKLCKSWGIALDGSQPVGSDEPAGSESLPKTK